MQNWQSIRLILVVCTLAFAQFSLSRKEHFSKGMPKKDLKASTRSTGRSQPLAPKRNAPEFTKETDDFIMSVLRGEKDEQKPPEETLPEMRKDDGDHKPVSNKQLRKIWDELINLGFSDQDAERGVVESSHLTLSSVLDWLCLNLEEERCASTLFHLNVIPDHLFQGCRGSFRADFDQQRS
mmetsp:Transcript_18237/g.50307  ORF Transcript_18237/g.50307 Transcript_18237/m.50307 type:complete len:181 (+) Transcript_18237:15-557(+)